MRHSALLLALLASGCIPALNDGAYACQGNGEPDDCPPDFVCRHDSRCHYAPNQGRVCQSDDECENEVCSLVEGSSKGYCTYHCSEDADCQGDLGSDARCVDGFCLSSCSDATIDCSLGIECQWPHQAMTSPPTTGSCVSIDSARFDGTNSCVSLQDCSTPGFCMVVDGTGSTDYGTTGVCSMWCDTDDNCPNGRCVTLLGGGGQPAVKHCLRECFPMMQGSSCQGGLVCGTLLGDGPHSSVCIPRAWDHLSVPFADATQRNWGSMPMTP